MLNDLLALIGFCVCLTVVFLYNFLAPWYRNRAGWYVMPLLWSITSLMGAVAARRFFGDYPGRQGLISITLLFVTACVACIGIGVIRAQFAGRKETRRKCAIANHPSNRNGSTL